MLQIKILDLFRLLEENKLERISKRIMLLAKLSVALPLTEHKQSDKAGEGQPHHNARYPPHHDYPYKWYDHSHRHPTVNNNK